MRDYPPPAVTGEKLLARGRFLSFKELAWVDAKGVARIWESAEREGFSGAVLVVPRLFPSRRMLLIRQYRPPARREVVEFPAGLINPGEAPEQAAARELREETGYRAKRLRVFPAAYSTPGMADESVHMVLADIDESAPENAAPTTEFDPSEMIDSVFVGLDDLADFYRSESEKGTAFDAKLAAYILAQSVFANERFDEIRDT